MLRDFRDSFRDDFYDQILNSVGEDVVYKPALGGSKIVRGVLQREFLELLDGAVAVESRNPIFQCKHKDMSCVAVGDVIEFDGLAWSVQSVQPDGREVVALELERCVS